MKLKLSELVSESGFQGLIEEEVQKRREEEAREVAKQVAQRFQQKVQRLRDIRKMEREAHKALKDAKRAIEKYDEGGDVAVLRKCGLYY